MRRSAHAGSNASVAVRRGSSARSTRPSRTSGIRQASLRGRRNDGFVERARLPPRPDSGCRDAIATLADGLIADDDGLVPALDQTIALEPRHELVERRTGPLHAVFGDDVTDDTAGLLG